MSQQHDCVTYIAPDGSLQESPFPGTCEGRSIDDCVEDHKGRLYAMGNGKSTQVNFCPFCGYPARVQIEWMSGKIYEASSSYAARLERAAQSLSDKIDNAKPGDVIHWENDKYDAT